MKNIGPAFPILLAAGLLWSLATGQVMPAMEIAAPKPPVRLDGRTSYYLDDQGLYVSSTGGWLEYPFSPKWVMKAQAVSDLITIRPPGTQARDTTGSGDPHAGHGGHVGDGGEIIDEHLNPQLNIDGVSGASTRISAGTSSTRELRGEGVVGLQLRDKWEGRPSSLGLELRGSREPDYNSMGGLLAGQTEAFQGNTTLSAFLGFSRDRISPDRAPPGQKGLWPAEVYKWSGGFTAAQSVTPQLLISWGLSAGLQQGTLASPYRYALVRSTLFPETLPGERLRLTMFFQSAYYLGWGTALHLRHGFYWDSWDVKAWIPETAVSRQMGRRSVLTLRHRFYAQTRAQFYQPVYPDREGFQTADLRLGKLYDQVGGAEWDFRLLQGSGRTGPLVLSASYEFSRLEYPDLGTRRLFSHVFQLGTTLEY